MSTSAADTTPSTKGSWSTSVGEKGEFKRKESQFRSAISADPNAEFPAESGRYHVYVSLACPWACRVLAFIQLKNLTSVISHTVVDHFLDGKQGWAFTSGDSSKPECEADPVFGFKRLRQVYDSVDKDYKGNVTVPCLVDKKTKKIVCNESSEIIRMLNSEFNAFIKDPKVKALNFYPEPLRAQIDAVNEWIYPTINNGVYRSGFAQSQSAYEAAVREVHASFDKCESILAKQRYIASNADQGITEADIRLFVTLIRSDAVYAIHFKIARLVSDYPNLSNYVRELYQMPQIKATVNFEHIRKHYFVSHDHINPFRIVPLGPKLDYLEQPSTRAAQFPKSEAARRESQFE